VLFANADRRQVICCWGVAKHRTIEEKGIALTVFQWFQAGLIYQFDWREQF